MSFTRMMWRDMANQFQIIADAMEKIAKCEQQIRDIKNENTCPSCGCNHFKGCAVLS